MDTDKRVVKARRGMMSLGGSGQKEENRGHL